MQAGQVIHKVDERDTLFGLALLYEISVKDIMTANHLDSELIRKGQELIIPLKEIPESVSEAKKEAQISTYRVRRGDTLSGIAVDLGLEQRQIIQLNRLDDSSVKLDQVLIIPGKAEEGSWYSIKSGDTMSRISLLFDISVDQLKQINMLTTDSLREGQILLVAPERPQIHIVEKGDSLWEIAREYKLTMDDIKRWNSLQNETIRPGQELMLYPWTVDNFEESARNAVPVLMASYREMPPIEEYANYRDEKSSQPSRTYSENHLENAAVNYRQARELLDKFDQSISRERKLSNDLKGYAIVIDPGHGGLDPGAIVPTVNGNGETVYVVEDEYAYDIALRTYRLLKLHGARVTMTIISPNHLIRSSENPSETFVNVKNEVYNMESMNRAGDDSSWPVGGSAGLRKRVDIAAEAFKGADRNKTLFISIHADNSPDHGQGTMVLYSSEEENNLAESRELAESLVPYLGASSTAGRQSLAVLRDNPASAEVLIEIRNLHYSGNSWAIRYDKLRQQDAEFITEGLRNYAAKRR